MLIIRRLNCIDAVSGFVTLGQWPSGAQVERELSQPVHRLPQKHWQLPIVIDGVVSECLELVDVSMYSFYTRWRSWLRHCATSRKVAGSVPGGVIGFFHWHNPSDRTMALGLTQPPTEMSTRRISWG
jgi:hypothetical protein